MPAPSPAFPFESRFLELPPEPLPSGARPGPLRLHTVEEGRGAPILFLHGNPTSSYLWRNVLPAAARHGRAIALDLLGHGLSDKPDVPYSYADHFAVLVRALDALDLRDLTLVVHDWGGFLGFHLALEQPERVRRICAMETFPWRVRWSELPLAARLAFRAFRADALGAFLIQRMNLFVRAVLPAAVRNRRAFSREARARYRSHYPTYASRRAVRRWPQHVPLGPESETWELAGQIERSLGDRGIPVLWLLAEPGLLVPRERAEWLRRVAPHFELRPVGPGAHFLPEEIPHRIAAELDRWLAETAASA